MNRSATERPRPLEIAERLIAFDTTVDEPSDAARDEQACQTYVAELLAGAGFEVDIWEPDKDAMCHHRNYVTGQHWIGRPNLVARLAGSGGSPSLLLAGHIDTVPAGPLSDWTTSPWSPDVRGGRLYGRGACDMKGGLGSMLAAALTVADSGTPLAGDLLVGLVTDEEVNGLGTLSMLERGYGADAAIVPEPNELDIHVAFRGILVGELRVAGRSGHVEIPQPDWRQGGAVNSISKTRMILDGLDRLSAEWLERVDKMHPLCSPGQIQVTEIRGGEFASSFPAECRATLNVCYVPGEQDDEGYGAKVQVEIADYLERLADADPWLAGRRPTIEWSVDFPPAEIDVNHPLALALARVLAENGGQSRIRGLDTWDDTVSLIRGGIPAVSFGPGSNDQAHAVDEYVEVKMLERHSELLTKFVLDWCGSNNPGPSP